MAKQFIDPVIVLVRKTTNNREGMETVVQAAANAITEVDRDIADLLTQRERLETVHDQYVALYGVLIGEELRSEVPRLPFGARSPEDYRTAVLETAEEQIERFRGIGVTEEQILSQVKRREGDPPWQNPKAVIATILLRSGKWMKNEQGRYVVVTKKE